MSSNENQNNKTNENYKDYLIRAMAADDQIRAFAITSKNIVEEARRRHNTSPVATAALGRLLSAGSMMGSMMKGEKDVLTLKIEGQGAIGGITVTADSEGNVKGYVDEPMVILPANAKHKLDVSGAIGPGTLSVIKDIGLKDPYIGQTDLVSGEIAEDLTYYYAASEQVPSSVALGVLMNKDNTVKQAGGFIIQLMPETSDETIDYLEKKLAGISSITTLLDSGMSPEDILEYVLGERGVTIMEKKEVHFRCDCSRERVDKVILSIGREELDKIIKEGKPIQLNCHFCNTNYEYTIEELKKLRDKAKK